MGRLEGKVAIVTGAARGTGEVIARHFVDEGARVVLGDLRDELGEKVAADLGDAALYRHLDVTSERDWEGAVSATLERFSAIHVLVNNAAVLKVASIADTSLEDFEEVLRVNQAGPFLGIRAVIEPLKAVGGGSIVNVASIDALEGMNGVCAYGSSKWGLRGLSKIAALELGRFGIRVNTVCPAAGSFEMLEPFMPGGVDLEKLAAAHPPAVLVHRPAVSNDQKLLDIARVVAFLASDESRSCTGGDYAVDSGYTAGKLIRGAPGS